jgi:uncharacterized protein YbbK (DUF523 family)
VAALAERFDVIPCCPEFELGLGVPREPIQLEGDADAPRLVALETGTDLTESMLAWCRARVDEFVLLGIGGAVLKSRSPSCGIGSCELVSSGDGAETTSGLFARTLAKRLPDVPTAEESELCLPGGLTRFIAMVKRAR